MGSLVFDSIRGFEEFLLGRAALADPYLVEGVRVAGQSIYLKARQLFGDADKLQPSLAPSTVRMRTERWGYYRRSGTGDPNATLLWSGRLRQSIEFMHEGLVAGVGSPDPVMQYQELGTPRIPPRPLLRISAQESALGNWVVIRHYAAKIIGVNLEGGGTVNAVLGGNNIANQFTGTLKRGT